MFLLTPKDLSDDISTKFINICSHSTLEDVKNMIKFIPKINAIMNNTTALISSASFGRIDIARFLLENGADPNIFNDKGYTALHCIVYLHSNGQEDIYLQIASLLIRHGSIVNLANFNGDKPIDMTKDIDMLNILNYTI